MKPNKTLFASVIFILSFAVYAITAAPGVTFTDSGELAAVCVTLGIAHPTGYPLFILLGHFWSLLPLPFSEIYSLNLFVGVLTAMSSVVFFFIMLSIFDYMESRTKKKLYPISLMLMAFATSLAYSFAATIWAQGVAIEVYSLQLLIFNLIIFVVIKATTSKQKNEKHFFLAALLIGLGFANHMTTVLVIPAVLFLFFKNPGEQLKFSSSKFILLLSLFIPLLVGLSLYIYLPLRSATGPEFNWGDVSRGLDKFLYHVMGKQYQVWMFTGEESIAKNLKIFIEILPAQLGWLGFVPFAFGLYKSFRSAGSIFVFLLLLIVVCLFYALNYSIHDIEAYFSLAFIAILIFAGIGIYGISKINFKYAAIFFIIPVISLAMNYSRNDRSDEYLVPEYTRTLVNNLEENAIIISSQWDFWCSAFWYYQSVEGYRTDVAMIENELLRRTWYPEQLMKWYPGTISPCKTKIKEFMVDLERFESGEKYSNMIQSRYENMINCFIDTHYGKRPVYITLDVAQKEPGIGKGYIKVPDGFAFRLEKEQRAYPVSVEGIDIDRFVESLKDKESHLVKSIMEVYSINLSIIGNYALNTNQRQTAQKAFQKALQVNPKNTNAINGLKALQQ